MSVASATRNSTARSIARPTRPERWHVSCAHRELRAVRAQRCDLEVGVERREQAGRAGRRPSQRQDGLARHPDRLAELDRHRARDADVVAEPDLGEQGVTVVVRLARQPGQPRVRDRAGARPRPARAPSAAPRSSERTRDPVSRTRRSRRRDTGPGRVGVSWHPHRPGGAPQTPPSCTHERPFRKEIDRCEGSAWERWRWRRCSRSSPSPAAATASRPPAAGEARRRPPPVPSPST